MSAIKCFESKMLILKKGKLIRLNTNLFPKILNTRQNGSLEGKRTSSLSRIYREHPHREHMNHSFSIYPIIGGQCFILKYSRTLNCINLFILSIPGSYCLGLNCWCTCEHREAATHPINLSSYMPFWSFAILRPTPADFCHCLLDPVDKTCPVWCWAIWSRLHRGKRKKK